MDTVQKQYETRNKDSMELTKRAFEFEDMKDIPLIFNTSNYFSFGYSPDEIPADYYTSIESMYSHQVAQFEAEHQPEGERPRVEHEIVDRPSAFGENRPSVLEGGPLPLVHEVVDQGVVHVETYGLDPVQAKVAVAINPLARRRRRHCR